jgi:hypothetical protein
MIELEERPCPILTARETYQAAIKMGLLARLERGPLAALGGVLLPIPAGNMAIFGIK